MKTYKPLLFMIALAVANTGTAFGAEISGTYHHDTAGFYRSGNLDGIELSLFERNSRTDGGAVYVTGNLTSGITSSTFNNNNGGGGAGGAVCVMGSLTDGINDSTFSDNRASNPGGALYVHVGLTDGITNSTFTSNTSSYLGGAVYVRGYMTGEIANSTFTDNKGSLGGALFLDTSNYATATDITLTASAGGTTLFKGNTAGTVANSLHFGRYNTNSLANAMLTVSGAGVVALHDPIRVDMNSAKNFTFTRDGGGAFLWGGTNSISTVGGRADFHFENDSRTTFLTDFTLKAAAGNGFGVFFGYRTEFEIVLSTLEADFRNASAALFDFSNLPATMFIGEDIKLTLSIGAEIPNLATTDYLFIANCGAAEYMDLSGFGSAGDYTFTLEVRGNDIWITDIELVPEPATWALMLGGLGVLALLHRRRNSTYV